MRALTILQPYADLIMGGSKRVENRTWPTKYRGRFYVHAGKSRDLMMTKDIDGTLYCRVTQKAVERMAFGCVVGIAVLLDCLPIEDIRAGKHDADYPWLRAHEHAEGPFCWVLAENPTPIGPWPYKGMQGLFDIHPETLNRIATHLEIDEPTS